MARRVLLGIGGGIAAYKAADLTRRLVRSGFDVRVVMTANAARFVAPLTFQALSGHPVAMDPWDDSEWGMSHIDRAREADLCLVAPATANLIARMAAGMADDLLTTTLLAIEAPVWVAPSMNPSMLSHPATRANLRTLTERGVRVLEPGIGEMACGEVGSGRLPEPESIAYEVESYFRRGSDLTGVRLLVTAGPTREPIDPVRYLSNPSSGRMGFAIADAAAERGADVWLVTGPVERTTPPRVQRIDVTTAAEMADAALSRFADSDIVIAAAAVADYTPIEPAPRKMKKSEDEVLLHLRKTVDILAEMGRRRTERQVLIGFAAETDDLIANGSKKLEEKNLDLLVANDITEPGAGFGVETNLVTLLDREGGSESLSLMPKRILADLLIDRAKRILDVRRGGNRPEF